MKELLMKPEVIQALASLLALLLGWLLVELKGFLSAKIKNEYLKGVSIRAADAVATAVKETAQVAVNDLKEASADGKLSDEEKAKVKADTIAKAKSYLGKEGLAMLMKILGLGESEVDGLLGAKIEAAVHDLKAAQNP